MKARHVWKYERLFKKPKNKKYNKIWISTENEKNVLTVLITFALLLERGRCFRKVEAFKNDY